MGENRLLYCSNNLAKLLVLNRKQIIHLDIKTPVLTFATILMILRRLHRIYQQVSTPLTEALYTWQVFKNYMLSMTAFLHLVWLLSLNTCTVQTCRLVGLPDIPLQGLTFHRVDILLRKQFIPDVHGAYLIYIILDIDKSQFGAHSVVMRHFAKKVRFKLDI